MVKWEYLQLLTKNKDWYTSDGKRGKLEKLGGSMFDEQSWPNITPVLNELGSEGWEVVGMYAMEVLLKRPLK